MENQVSLKFKTNLNCSNCVSKVQADFDQHPGIAAWSVDTDNSDKILTVSSKNIGAEEVIAIVNKKGFKAEVI